MDLSDEVWVAGEVLIDLIPDLKGSRIPVVGGGGANTAKALARLGIPTRFIDGISTDEYGELSRYELENSGVDLSLSMASEKPTALATVTLNASGGASYEFALQGSATFDFDRDWLPVGFPKVIHCGTLATIIEPGAEALYQWAKSINAPKVFDPNIRSSVLSDRDKYRGYVEKWIAISDVIKLSDDDLLWLYPNARNFEEALDIARSMLQSGPSLVVITRGEKGMVGITNAGAVEVPGVRVDVIDTVGAGDTVGAILVEAIFKNGLDSLINGELERTLKRAAKAAAITCSRAGAQPPSAEELLE